MLMWHDGRSVGGSRRGKPRRKSLYRSGRPCRCWGGRSWSCTPRAAARTGIGSGSAPRGAPRGAPEGSRHEGRKKWRGGRHGSGEGHTPDVSRMLAGSKPGNGGWEGGGEGTAELGVAFPTSSKHVILNERRSQRSQRSQPRGPSFALATCHSTVWASFGETLALCRRGGLGLCRCQLSMGCRDTGDRATGVPSP